MENLSDRTINNTNVLNSAMVKMGDQERHTPTVEGGRFSQSSWLNNNNNSLAAKGIEKQKQYTDYVKEQVWNCDRCSCTGIALNFKHITCASAVADEGGGILAANKQSDEKFNGSDHRTEVKSTTVPSIATVLYNDCDACADGAGAASLTPPGNSYSNRTSVNNSTENLSYSSDNYYPDDLILLDDDDVEAEEISLNSDDCVYAYRGEGAEFDLAIDALSRRSNNAGIGDDETDFLEMDFEPDPSSEVEYGSAEVASSIADAFLMQRDAYHLSGRHSANMNLHQAHTQRQLFSSPIDDLPPPKALQSQSMLSKNFARISMHLDQIKGENGDDIDNFKRARIEPLPLLGLNLGDNADRNNSASHSLPNTLRGNFGRDTKEQTEIKTSPSKITGAKPKRFSTFSASSSTSSKTSSKSRYFLRSSTFAPALCSSNSYDERSVSCTEFRSALIDDCPLNTTNPSDDFNTNDETCLDCLEKEFLANTIGKEMDTNVCPKCHKRGGSSISIYARAEHARCRSGSPSFFNNVQDEHIFDVKKDFFNVPRKIEDDWQLKLPKKEKLVTYDGVKENMRLNIKNSLNESARTNQRTTTCDNYDGEQQLLKNLVPIKPEKITISTLNLSEETLMQALNILDVSYNEKLIKSHFKENSSLNEKLYESLHIFLLHESMKNCNHPKLKFLIELATKQQISVEYKKDMTIIETEVVSVSVPAIMQQWMHNKDLASLKKLDKRFDDDNVLGKIASIIRQAQQNCTSRRPLPEFISIPQYYDSGYLHLKKNC